MDKALGGRAAWELHGRCLGDPLCTGSRLGIQMVPAVFIRNQFAEQSLESPSAELTFADDRLRHTFLHRPLRRLLSLGAFLLGAVNLQETHLCLLLSHLISTALGRGGEGGREDGAPWVDMAAACRCSSQAATLYHHQTVGCDA